MSIYKMDGEGMLADALCDMYDIRNRSKVHKFDVLAKDGDGTETTIGDCITNVIDVLETLEKKVFVW